MESKTTKSPHPTGESRGQIDTMNQHGKPEDAQARGTLTTPRYMIMLPDKVGDIPSYACCGSYGWSLWHDKKFATSREHKHDAVEAQKRAPNKIKYDGVVIDV